MKKLNRRDFTKLSGTLAGAIAGVMPNISLANVLPSSKVIHSSDLSIHIFSKLLHFLNIEEMSAIVKEIGFTGIDLTVRPEGHINPEKVAEELPKAVEIIKKNQLETVMMTTAITSIEDAISQKVIKTAAKLGFKHYRTGWLKYSEDKSIAENLEISKHLFQQIEQFNQELKICASYQNHSGNYIGASIWDLWEILKNQKTESLGIQYDVRHATIEGGNSWHQDLRLISPYIKTLAIKDCIWQKKSGAWQAVSVPIGEGMVDFIKYFKFLQKNKIQVPISLHLEYALGGAENGNRKISIDKSEVFKAMKQDLQKVKELWDKAAT